MKNIKFVVISTFLILALCTINSCELLNPFNGTSPNNGTNSNIDIKSQGDINLNGIPYEIVDGVLLSNYYLYGEYVFMIDTEAQIVATDVNNDGVELSVADYVYMVRVLIGDAEPKPTNLPKKVYGYVISDSNGYLSIELIAGAALILIEGDIIPRLLANNMDIRFTYDGINTRVFVHSLEGNTFSGPFLDPNGDVVSVEIGSAQGSMVFPPIIE